MSTKKLSQSEKAAVILLAVGEEDAAEILRGLPHEDVRRIIGALARLGRIDQLTVDDIMNEFADTMTAMKQGLEGSPQAAARFLTQFSAQRGIDLFSIVDTATPELRDTLTKIDRNILSNHLRKEHPQAVAMIAVHMAPKAMGQLLKDFSPEQRTNIIERIAKLGPIDPDVICEITDSLKTLAADAGRVKAHMGGVAHIASTLNTLAPGDQEAMLKSLAERDPTLCEAVRAAMFTFQDLMRIESRSMQRLLREISDSDLRAALRGADQALIDHVFKAMSERNAKQLAEDLADGKKLPLQVIETARTLIATTARSLIDKGEIQLSDELISIHQSA